MTAAHVTAGTLIATRSFAKCVACAYPTQKAIFAGSCARGTAYNDSDADVAIILKGSHDDKITLR